MTAVAEHTETPARHLGDPLRGPHVGAIAVGHRAAQELTQQQLPRREFERAPGRGLHPKRLLNTPGARVAPTRHRTWHAADLGRKLVQVEASVEQSQGAATKILEHPGGAREAYEDSFRRSHSSAVGLADVRRLLRSSYGTQWML